MPRALVLGGDVVQQQRLGELLAEKGYEACLCADIADAHAHLEAHPHQLVVLDLTIAGISISVEDIREAGNTPILIRPARPGGTRHTGNARRGERLRKSPKVDDDIDNFAAPAWELAEGIDPFETR